MPLFNVLLFKMFHMRLLRYSCLAAAFVLCLASCSHKAERKEAGKDAPAMTLDGRDTTAVYDLTKQFLELLKAKKVDEAVNMLYFLDSDMQVVALPDSLAERQRMVFRKGEINYGIHRKKKKEVFRCLYIC